MEWSLVRRILPHLHVIFFNILVTLYIYLTYVGTLPYTKMSMQDSVEAYEKGTSKYQSRKDKASVPVSNFRLRSCISLRRRHGGETIFLN